jgi:hypothetical protein
MKHSTPSLGFVALVAACADPPPLPNMNLDGLPAIAVLTPVGSRDFLEISIDPHGAKLGGETVGMLWFRLDLTRTPDCTSTCPVMTLDGATAHGSLVYGVLTYDVGQPLARDGACPLTQEGDPLQLPRGTIAGTFSFQRLDRSGTELSIMLLPTFGLGFPDPGVTHEVVVAPIDVTFVRP